MPAAALEPLSVGSEHLVRFTDLLANGQAVGRIGPMVVFVWGPLPGEDARVRVTETKKAYAVGALVELVGRSPDRADPFCAVFGTCGGCQVQHLAYPAQLRWKQRLVADALQRIGGFENPSVAETIGMDVPRAYRNKMALVVRHEGATGTGFGFYQMRSHDFVPIERCPIVLPQLEAQLEALRAEGADPQTGAAFARVRHAVARAGLASGESVVALTTEKQATELAAAAPRIAERLPGVVGISNSFEPSSANAVLGRKNLQLWGRSEMEERIAVPGSAEPARYRVSAASFLQVNSAMVGRIFEFLGARLSGASRIVDLYCGAGTFSILFARLGLQVVGIEENPAAIREANANAALNGVSGRARFLSGRVEAVLARPPGREALRSAEVVFLDPPRKGSDEHTLDALSAAGVPEVWYLSCNPSTLARDLAHLRAAGYHLGEVQPFDLFPQTGHVETFVAATKDPAGGRRRA